VPIVIVNRQKTASFLLVLIGVRVFTAFTLILGAFAEGVPEQLVLVASLGRVGKRSRL